MKDEKEIEQMVEGTVDLARRIGRVQTDSLFEARVHSRLHGTMQRSHSQPAPLRLRPALALPILVALLVLNAVTLVWTNQRRQSESVASGLSQLATYYHLNTAIDPYDPLPSE